MGAPIQGWGGWTREKNWLGRFSSRKKTFFPLVRPMPDSFFSFPCILLRTNPSPQKKLSALFPLPGWLIIFPPAVFSYFHADLVFFGCLFEVFRNPRHPLPPPLFHENLFSPSKAPLLSPSYYVRTPPAFKHPLPNGSPPEAFPLFNIPPFLYIYHPVLLNFPPAQKKRSFPSASPFPPVPFLCQ